MVLLSDVSYVSFHRQDSTYHIVYYTSCAALVRNSSVEGRKEENVLFNDAQHILFCGYMVLDTIMVKNHSDGLLFSISSKGSYMHHPTDRIAHTTAFVTPVVDY